MQYRNRARQAGFTLVEIAIVLVIIGLLLGGVLKGQEMIENAKIKSIVGDMKAVQAAYNGYVDRYKAIPGDETVATMTGRGWIGGVAPTGTAGDGVLAITTAQTFTNGGGQAAFWSSLRFAGLIAGDPKAPATQAGLQTHGGGGVIGVTAGPAYGMPGLLVCASQVTTKQAAGIDALIDGKGAANNTGSLRGARATNANTLAPAGPVPATVTTYDETSPFKWTICMPL
jgi:prepilin-type N-terminal cleavage/methylation domain-containing protein